MIPQGYKFNQIQIRSSDRLLPTPTAGAFIGV